MPALSVINGDLQVLGQLSSTTMVIPDNSVTSDSVQSTGLASNKLIHLHKIFCDFGFEIDEAPSTSTTYRFPVYRATATSTINVWGAALVDTGTQANTNDFTFHLYRIAAGAETVLDTIDTDNITIDSDSTDNTFATTLAASLDDSTLDAGDILVVEMVTPATITAAHGPMAFVEISELGQY